ncbi:hypothetical protein GGTG_08430 [Gaeumannomyces tritici R3-111a-1]|uniref:Uncharacterized protein n=1 Tax=Gaeumannomyces tritici (strain R3-111a-1) TaxID=644352 RepID=J3P4J3_GAET3|nr:hypothetical protein GGTG_08430 [Gaeumannomyces tritici R3-111a-1]EJT74590.1 hypothetical protein GGTG_08430 [Gaeumannomyces tritici R3-111a-1]
MEGILKLLEQHRVPSSRVPDGELHEQGRRALGVLAGVVEGAVADYEEDDQGIRLAHADCSRAGAGVVGRWGAALADFDGWGTMCLDCRWAAAYRPLGPG